jgi:hypothetical protein
MLFFRISAIVFISKRDCSFFFISPHENIIRVSAKRAERDPVAVDQGIETNLSGLTHPFHLLQFEQPLPIGVDISQRPASIGQTADITIFL